MRQKKNTKPRSPAKAKTATQSRKKAVENSTLAPAVATANPTEPVAQPGLSSAQEAAPAASERNPEPESPAPAATATAGGTTQRPAQATPDFPAQPQKLSALAAALQVLQETAAEMTCPQLIERMSAQGYWTSPGGKTPAATLHAALIREIKNQGAQARVRKTARGKFAAATPQA
jgi:HB1, ASXL, restriction endonuclease HTH domain